MGKARATRLFGGYGISTDGLTLAILVALKARQSKPKAKRTVKPKVRKD